MYAIRNVLTGEFLYGTDYSYNPPHQRTSFTEMKTYGTLLSAKSDFMIRRCDDNFQIVVVNVEIIAIVDSVDEN